jgi:hypothetical protein
MALKSNERATTETDQLEALTALVATKTVWNATSDFVQERPSRMRMDKPAFTCFVRTAAVLSTT